MTKVFVAKQPIFNRKKEVFAYELLYRDNDNRQAIDINGDLATIEVMLNSFLNIGIEKLSGDHPVFINFTENLLKNGVAHHFNSNNLIVELLETIEITDALEPLLKDLYKQGYRLALDDVTREYFGKWERAGLLKYLTFVKVDFMQMLPKERTVLAKTISSGYPNIKLLAEKVETIAEFEEAIASGYHYFQGFFFMRPQLMETREIPSFFGSYMTLLREIDGIDFDLKTVSEIIQNDLSLTYKLLKLINSLMYRRVEKINSIHQAVVLLGQKEIKKWIYVLALRESYHSKELQVPGELIRSSYYRAKMCERIAVKCKMTTDSEAFLIGYFSQLPVILRQPASELYEMLSLDDSIESALKGVPSTLTDIYRLAVAVEKVEWGLVDQLVNKLALSKADLLESYQIANDWVHDLMAY